MELTPLDPWIARKIGCPAAPLARADIEAYQLRQIQETLHLVRAKSPFYRRHLAAAPPEVTSLAGLAQFPFTTPEDIRAQALQFLCVSQSDIARVVTLDSSGTTGPPKRLYFTKEDQELTLDFFHHGMATFTGAGDRVLILLPGERPGSVGDLLVQALPRLEAVGLRHGPGHEAAKTWAVMEAEQVTGLVGLPVQVLALARYRPPPPQNRPPLKSILLTADHVPEAIKRVVEQTWGCRVYNHYGMTEMGLGGGVECAARRGYHLREADLYIELINPASGEPVTEGETGEVVFTTLTRRGMPLIRYRTGDLSRFIPGQCPCGTVLKTLACLRSRVGGGISLAESGYLSFADLDEALFPIEGVLDFSADLIRQEGRDCLQLVVSLAEGGGADLSPTILKALETIPAIRLARLEVSLRFQAGRNSDQTGMTKRVIGER